MSQWKQVTKRVPCPICGRPDWCTISGDNLAVKCMRVESKRPIKQADGQSAWIHPITDSGKFSNVASIASKPMPNRLTMMEIKSHLKEYALGLSSQRLQLASKELGLSAESLKAFGVGYSDKFHAYTFPMFDGARKPIGIRLRMEDGKKLCVPGSRNGLFIPSNYDPHPIPGEICADAFPVLIMPEGPTDAATAIDLGFASIGRPNNVGGGEILTDFLTLTCPQEVIVIADRDAPKQRPDGKVFFPGIEGALRLCEQILDYCGRLRFMMPPGDAKDIRQWWLGKNHAEFLAHVMAAPRVTRPWIVAAKVKLEEKRSRTSCAV